ncbi:4-diphosphocytidyl-2-C-methyl-D-erythritol kinase [Desulfohalotomaculum tongense]|uniref:4-(cytidine 5'-diphospho)-2-C-methyl-D-erythritol kinase n=1 Tax=Desulforadius tongensis TaxID=1216062 RepID=UPI001958FB91|nr:4-(cytidine 5'-diphospho)-2-C-methyl-D-erythritol kinase [Desulforadius tongensis]MBM7855200.1 4-diphosphocytidyl-2-C-methyl-D-erythritol kinase [Desulforadius tongensis]
MQLKLKAHAKINLTLKVLGKRSDGYHQLETIMQSLELHDELTIEQRKEGIELSVQGAVPAGRDNLAYRAAEVIKRYTRCSKGCFIYLVKRIPVAAGLAGGSTDAAAVLLGLNKLWDLGLTKQELLQLAEKLGADVPFCLWGGTALARGKGEELTPLPGAPEMGVVLVKPHFGVSTAEVYRGWAGACLGERPDTAAMIAALQQGSIAGIAKNLANDLEYVTLQMHPQLQEIKEAVKKAGADGVLMSGSGPTIFGLTDSEEQAREIAGRLKIPGARVIATATLS